MLSMPSIPKPAGAWALGALVFGLAGPAAAPAHADFPVFALEATRILPVPEHDAGHTTPNVALRGNGGYLAVWADIDTGKIVGRRLGPVDASGDSESQVFELSAENATLFGPVATARGADGSYLAVWQTPPPAPTALVARSFDGDGQQIRPSQVVVPESELSPFGFDLAARPGGGHVLVWGQQGLGGGWEVRYRFLDPSGMPFGSVRVAGLPDGTGGPWPRVAVGADGGFVVTWSWQKGPESVGAVEARGFSGLGQPLGPPFDLVPEGSQFYEIQHDVTSVGDGDYLLAWAADSAADEPPQSIRALRFAGDGGDLGPDHRIDAGDEPDRLVTHPALTDGPGGDVVATWAEGTPYADRPRGRLLDGDGEPRSDPFDLVPGPVTGADTFVNGVDVDRDAEGRLVFGWGIGFVSAFIPTGAEAFLTSQARRFRETEAGCHPVLTLDFRTEPADPDGDDAVRLLFEGLADCAEVFLAGSTLDGGTFHVEAEAETLGCGTVPPFPFSVPADVGTLAAGGYDVEIEIALPEGGTCDRSFGFTVEPAGPVEPPPPPPPPEAPPLTTDALPGFRFWVEITDQAGDAILGSKVEPCIPETLCVSGRLPGRHEVFARIVGPKPNGRLWPTLVKFSTSQVEVWIEQVGTGEVEYYLLEGARPGFDELPGLFDREGFEP